MWDQTINKVALALLDDKLIWRDVHDVFWVGFRGVGETISEHVWGDLREENKRS